MADNPNNLAVPIHDHSKSCCHRTDGTSRNLIVCIDGTANQFGAKNTNVIELYNLILKGVKGNQRTWYNSGIGTYVRPSRTSLRFYQQFLYHTIDLAIAWDFKRTILAAYRWLSDNYEPGDCIFLFGFSRGAFQVRVLSAMIHKVGLIYKGNEMQIPFAYELYADPKSDKRTATEVGSPDHQDMSSANRFKKAFSYEGVTVHFVGAWDSVSSIGIARGKVMLPGTVDGMQHVCYFRHALALDERRVKFLPEYAYGGSAKPPGASKDRNSSNDTPPADSIIQGSLCAETFPPKILEVWFAGTHSDIGGGNADNIGMNRSRPPLRWMVFEAGALGLRTALFERELKPSEQIDFKESLTLPWWPLELLFFRRLTYTRREPGNTTTHRPHLGSSRKIHEGQKIHSSFILTNETGYTPKARPLNDDSSFWEKVRNNEKVRGDWLERDLYTYANDLVEQYITKQDIVVLQTLRQIATSSDGRQAVCKSLYNGVIGALRNPALAPKIKCQLLDDTMDILRTSSRELKVTHLTEIRALVSGLQTTNIIPNQTAEQFVAQCTDPRIFVLRGHTGFVCSVAFSPDGRHVASGSNDHTVLIWDVEMGKLVGKLAGGHRGYVTSVAFSHNGKQLVSGSSDKTLRIWDAETGKLAGDPLEGHTDGVSSVAFSPDNTHIVSGSDDQTIRLWDAKMENVVEEPLQKLANRVWSVAFSPDGTQIVSGSSDHTVQIWDTRTRNAVAEPFKGHTDSVRSVAFSADGRFVVSGSADHTIRVWDVQRGKLVGEPFRGHTGRVSSVAFSLDGKRVVSGSSDFTARIWDAKSGKPMGVLTGHGGAVTSVAFSPDSRRVASGSSDRTVLIWDVETE